MINFRYEKLTLEDITIYHNNCTQAYENYTAKKHNKLMAIFIVE